MSFKVQILSGRDVTARAKIEIALRQNQKDVPMLENLIKDMESHPHEDSDWWLSINEDTNLPNGFISVLYDGNISYLTRLWTKATSSKELDFTSQALLKEWQQHALDETSILVADLYPHSPLIKTFEKMGFFMEKPLISVYDVPTRYAENPPLENVYLDVPRKEDAGYIYDYLVEPDLDVESPIYVSKSQFLDIMTQQKTITEGAVVAREISSNQIIGFGGSFMQGPPGQQMPVLYGPHAFEDDVMLALIDEFLSFWKMKKQAKLRIIRIQPFSSEIVAKYNMKQLPKYSQSRFKYFRKD